MIAGFADNPPIPRRTRHDSYAVLALKVYARQRNDVDMERWVAEIKLRADVRIGEISRGLETAQGANQHLLNTGKKRKSEALKALKAAGISTSAEQLAAERQLHYASHDKRERAIQTKIGRPKPIYCRLLRVSNQTRLAQ